MIYSESDIVLLTTNDDDASNPDRDQDIKVRHAKSKLHSLDQQNQQQQQVQQKNGQNGDIDEEDDDDDFFDDDDDEEDPYAEWNLRKCAALALDVISNTCDANELLQHLLPILQEKLNDQNWTVRESGILALGAIAEGMYHSLSRRTIHSSSFFLMSLLFIRML